MYVVVSVFYAIIAWLALLAWLIASGTPVLLFLMATPFVISALVIVVAGVWFLLITLRWMWRCRGTLRRP